jgi:hypothetical protein
MERRKKASEMAEASVAYLMNMALEPKEIEATKSAPMPLDDLKQGPPAIPTQCLSDGLLDEKLSARGTKRTFNQPGNI